MTAPQMRVLRREARVAGAALIAGVWLLLTAASLGAPLVLDGWVLDVALVSGGGLVVWGSLKTKVERLEQEVEKRLSREVFTQFHGDLTDRLDRIERKLDGP